MVFKRQLLFSADSTTVCGTGAVKGRGIAAALALVVVIEGATFLDRSLSMGEEGVAPDQPS